MQSATTLAVALAGLFFSLACALLLEELFFGGLFRFFFAQRTGRSRQKLQLHSSPTKASMENPAGQGL